MNEIGEMKLPNLKSIIAPVGKCFSSAERFDIS